MAKSTNGTKNLKEALTPDQVSKVEDKYKSIYSGMLKGNKKKLMKYIDPKLKRPNPDAMAMGRAINLVKKETETETVNENVTNWPKELTSRYSDEYRFELEKVTPTYQDKPGRAKYRVIDIESGELKGTPVFGKPEHLMAYADDLIKPQGGTQSSHFGESLNEDNSYDSFKTDATERFLNRSQVVELLPVLKNSLNKLNFSPSKQPTLSVKRYGLSSSNKGYVISMYVPTSKDDIIVELGKYPKDDKTDEVSISLYLPNEEGRLTQVAYETSTSPKGEELAEDSNVLSKVISMANQWYEKPTTMVKEEAGMPPSPNANTGDLFSSLEATGKLEAPQGGASMVGQNYTLNGDSKYDKMFFHYEPNSPTPFGLKQIGGHGLDSRFLSKFGLKPTQTWTAGVDQFIFDGNYNPRWFDEKRFSEIVDHFSGGLSREAKRQRDFYKDRGQTSGTIDERLNTLVKEVYTKKQKDFMCAMTKPGVKRPKGLSKSEAEEMCKDTAISKKKLKESTDELEKLELDLYNMIQSKTRDSQIVSTYAKYKRKGGKKELGNIAQGLKETTMKNDRLTELIKAALTGPVKEGGPGGIDDEIISKEDRKEKLKRKEEEEMEKSSKKDLEAIKSATKGLDDEAMMESSTLKEGIWSMGTVTQIQDFLRDLNRLKDKYYNIVGSDDVFDGLDRAERSAEEMMMNAPENRSMNEELATTPIKDDIYAIGSRIYKDPYEAISLVATDQTVVVRDFARKDKKFKAAVMDYVKSKGLETSVDRDGLYIDTKPLDFKGMPLMNEKQQRPDYPDIDGDGDTKEPMAKAAKDKEKAEANESFDSLAKKLDKQKGITKDEAAKIAGSIAAKKMKGAGKGPTAKQKKRMAESILKKLRG